MVIVGATMLMDPGTSMERPAAPMALITSAHGVLVGSFELNEPSSAVVIDH